MPRPRDIYPVSHDFIAISNYVEIEMVKPMMSKICCAQNSDVFAASSRDSSHLFAARYRQNAFKPEHAMKKHHPHPAMELPISMEIHQQLNLYACKSGFELEDWEVGAIALRDWLARHAPDTFRMPVTAGYQWKRLFLPHGTLLRTIFKGKNYHCMVDQDQLLHDGVATSPSTFVNAVGGVNRNAWNVVWIMFPQTQSWKLAADLRVRDRKPAR
jgi:hypothetical protein